jgi:hypothetical protein
MELAEFQANAEQGRRLVSEMCDKEAFDANNEVKALACFATWQGFVSTLPREVQIQAIRMSIEAAYKLGQLRA